MRRVIVRRDALRRSRARVFAVTDARLRGCTYRQPADYLFSAACHFALRTDGAARPDTAQLEEARERSSFEPARNPHTREAAMELPEIIITEQDSERITRLLDVLPPAQRAASCA